MSFEKKNNFSNWPLTQPTAESMAAAGFYHTGPDDEVMSPFMMKEIGGWEEDDDPRVEVFLSLFGCLILT